MTLLIFLVSTPSSSTPLDMADATAKLSELLSAARERRTIDDALGFPRRKPSTKTILSITHSRTHRCLLPAKSKPSVDNSRPSSISSDPDGGESPDLAASMRLVRSYAARVRKMTPSPEPTAFPPFQPHQGNSFIDRSRKGAFRRESLHRRQSLSSPPVTRERSPEPASSFLRAQHLSPEPAPTVSSKATTFLAPRLIAEKMQGFSEEKDLIAVGSPPARASSDASLPAPHLCPLPFRRASTGLISTGLHDRFLPVGPRRRLLSLPSQNEEVVKTAKTRNLARRASEEAPTTVKSRNAWGTSEDPAKTVKARPLR